MKSFRTKVVNRIKSLEDIEGVTVTPSDEKKTIYVEFKTHRSLDFKFGIWGNLGTPWNLLESGDTLLIY